MSGVYHAKAGGAQATVDEDSFTRGAEQAWNRSAADMNLQGLQAQIDAQGQFVHEKLGQFTAGFAQIRAENKSLQSGLQTLEDKNEKSQVQLGNRLDDILEFLKGQRQAQQSVPPKTPEAIAFAEAEIAFAEARRKLEESLQGPQRRDTNRRASTQGDEEERQAREHYQRNNKAKAFGDYSPIEFSGDASVLGHQGIPIGAADSRLKRTSIFMHPRGPASASQQVQLNNSYHPPTPAAAKIYQPTADDDFTKKLPSGAQPHEAIKFFDLVAQHVEVRPYVTYFIAQNIHLNLLKDWAAYNGLDYTTLYSMSWKELQELCLRTYAPQNALEFEVLMSKVVVFEGTALQSGKLQKLMYIKPYASQVRCYAFDLIRMTKVLLQYAPQGIMPDYWDKGGLMDQFKNAITRDWFTYIRRLMDKIKEPTWEKFLLKFIDAQEQHIVQLVSALQLGQSVLSKQVSDGAKHHQASGSAAAQPQSQDRRNSWSAHQNDKRPAARLNNLADAQVVVEDVESESDSESDELHQIGDAFNNRANPKQVSTTKSLACYRHALGDRDQPCPEEATPSRCKFSHDEKICKEKRNQVRKNLLRFAKQDATSGPLHSMSGNPASAEEEVLQEALHNKI